MSVVEPAALTACARWLQQDAEPDDWSLEAAQRLAATFGREVSSTDAVDVCVVPVDEGDARFADGRGCRELAIPVAVLPEHARSVDALAGTFHDAGAAVAEALGPATSLGSHGAVGPWFGGAPTWGAPFLRWRRPQDRTVELRATLAGADLVLQPTEPYENWRRHAHEWSEPGVMGGFVHEQPVPENEGLYTPGAQRIRSWKQWQPILASFLRTLPAETAALGTPLYITILRATTRVYITSSAGGELTVRMGLHHLEDPVASGWRRTTERFDPWQLDAGRAGTVDGDTVAATLVQAIRAEKVRSLAGLATTRPRDGLEVLYGLGLG